MNDPMLSGDDSGLQNLWEEVCVQVQLQHSHFWNIYEEMMESMVEHEVSKLKPHQLMAAWLCTEAGNDWRFDDEEKREEPSADAEQVAHWVYTEHLMSLANNYTNVRVQEYLENSSLD